MNGAAAADPTPETLVALVNIWWAEDNYALHTNCGNLINLQYQPRITETY